MEHQKTYNTIWLLLTDLHGKLRGKLVKTSDLEKVKTEMPGVFLNDKYDLPVQGFIRGDTSTHIIAIPKSPVIQMSYPMEFESQGAMGAGLPNLFAMCNAYTDIETTEKSLVCCRTLLQNAVDELAEAGYEVKCGFELEWLQTNKDGNAKYGALQSYSMEPMLDTEMHKFLQELIHLDYSFYLNVERSKLGPVKIETVHAESGISLLEAVLSPSDPLTVADSVQLYRMAIEKLSRKYGMYSMFRAQPFFSASSGCGAHVHISLKSLTTEKPTKEVLYNQFIAGMLYHMKSSSCLLLPFKNSFERINQTTHHWTSNSVSYGKDDRLAAIRLVHDDSDGDDARIELRIPGADVNPYLVLLYCIKAGTWGIQNNIAVDTLVREGEAYDHLPTSLADAVTIFLDKDGLTRKLYGSAFVDHYGTLKKHEGRPGMMITVDRKNFDPYM
jgi:glutamine synthetase